MRAIILIGLILFAGCSRKGDPAEVPAYLDKLRSDEVEVRVEAVESLVLVGPPAIPELERDVNRHHGKLAGLVRDYLKSNKKNGASLFELRVVAGSERLKGQIKEKRLRQENYSTPAGFSWRPVANRAWPVFGGHRETLLKISERRWTEKLISKMEIEGSALSYELQKLVRDQFRAYTKTHVGHRMAILILGRVVAVSQIERPSDGVGELSGLSQDELALLVGVHRATTREE